MHVSVVQWVGAQVIQWGLIKAPSVLEVGALNVNGSCRDFFQGSYVGVDLEEGPGVDVIMDGEALDFQNESFDIVLSTEMLEHCYHPWKVVSEMARVLRPGGFLLLTARGFDARGAFALHNYPDDLWRFGEHAFYALVEDTGLVMKEFQADWEGPGWFALAVKEESQ